MTSRDDWWSQYHDVLAEGRLSRDEVAAVAREADVTLREGTVELMHLLHERKVRLFGKIILLVWRAEGGHFTSCPGGLDLEGRRVCEKAAVEYSHDGVSEAIEAELRFYSHDCQGF